MIDNNLTDLTILENSDSFYFIQYKDKYEYEHIIRLLVNKSCVNLDDIDSFMEDDFALHKKYVKEGVNPDEIATIIRNDEIEKLQEISSQNGFNFNQTIKPSLYERCSFINQKYVSLIDYAAFFSSVKCFKYLLMNGVEVENTGKYAVAGGNEEIIHLCEQNHSSFEGAYEAAIMFHRNDVFHYLYENKLAPDIGITQTLLESKCLEFCNYELIEFVETNFTESNNVKEKILCEIPALSMNIYNVLYLYAKKKLSVSKFIELRNYDVAQFILDHKLVNIYKKNLLGETYLMKACRNDKSRIVKFLLNKKININAKTKGTWFKTSFIIPQMHQNNKTAIMEACRYGNYESIKFLLQQNNINLKLRNGCNITPLMMAALGGNAKKFKLLLEHEGFDMNDNDIKIVFDDVINNYRIEILKIILEQEEFDVNTKSNDGKTSLIWASSNGHTEIVKLLIKHEGIDVNAKDNIADKALFMTNDIEIIKLFIMYKVSDILDEDIQVLLKNVSEEDANEIMKLLNKNPNKRSDMESSK